MAAHKVQLQVAQLARFDVNIGQTSESGVNAVDGLILCDDSFDNVARGSDSRACSRGERNWFFVVRYRDNLRERQSLAIELYESSRQ